MLVKGVSKQQLNVHDTSTTSAFSKLSPWVAKLVKSFEAPYEITESLYGFRYEPNDVFSFEDVLVLCPI